MMTSFLRRAGAYRLARINFCAALTVLAAAALITPSDTAEAMNIQQVRSPGGIEAWLVEEHSVPLMALRFAFEGGSSQDPAGKEGVANFLSAMLDEGAGDLTSSDFQERMEELAMRMSFEDSRDSIYGNFETLTANRDKSVDLLKLAVTKPRFDEEAVNRIRQQLQASLVYAARDPDRVAAKEWQALAFGQHVYGRPANGTEESLASVTREDLEAYRSRVLAKDGLKIVAVGDIDAGALSQLLDHVFGALPAKGGLTPVAKVAPVKGGKQKVIEMNVPQSVAVFGLGAMERKDPDFMPAFVLNHILGGGGFASRLMEEVREKRGLAYSVYSYLQPYRHTSVFSGSVATKNEAMGQSLELIRTELTRMAEKGPTPAELENAKKFLIGSYALRFDTNAKIASQLLGLMQEDLGADYVEKRNRLVEAVTLDDVKRVAAGLLEANDLIVTVVGKPKNVEARG